MALNINGRMKVKTLKSDFKKEFGLNIRIYDGKKFADDDATLASIRKKDIKGGEFSPKKNTKVGNLEDKFMDLFGLKIQVTGSDDSYLCNNDLTLAGALEEDEKKMGKKKKSSADENQIPQVVDEIKTQKEYPHFMNIGFGIIIEDTEDLWDCLVTPGGVTILSTDNDEEYLVIAAGKIQKEFDDINEAYEFCAEFIVSSGEMKLSKEVIVGMITSAVDEDEDGMYEIMKNEGGEILLSQTVYIQNLLEQAEEEGLNNTDLYNKSFCLIQYTDQEDIKISGQNLSVNGESVDIEDLFGSLDSLSEKVCVYVN